MFNITLVLIACVLVISVITVTARRCSFAKQCKCYRFQTLIGVQCSKQGLKSIPKLPITVFTVDLSHNSITDIGERHFEQNTNLRILDLSFNKLTELTNQSFFGLENLSDLTLNNNNITVFGKDVFMYLHALTFLDIKKTQIHLMRLCPRDMPSLIVLKADLILDVDNITLPEFLTHVKHLDVSGTSGKCRIKTITPSLFKYLTDVEYLDISKCRINTVYKGSFRKMVSLSTLDVSNNMCLKFTGVKNISLDLPYTSIKILKVNKVHKPFDLNIKVSISQFMPLKRTNLTEIHVESNRIQLIETGLLMFFPTTIRVLAMSDNEFSYGTYLFELSTLPVEFINASDLFASHMPNFQDEICDRRLDNNHVTDKDLSISDNSQEQIRKWSTEFKMSSSFSLQIPKNLKTLIYRNCRLRYAVPSFGVSDNKLEHLDGGNNLFFAWIGPIMVFNYVKYLDLSNNFCSNVSTVFFRSAPNLEVLSIEGNLLGFIFPGDINGNILQHIPKVKEINMAENRIPYLPYQFFREQTNLSRLTLASNMLEDVSFNLNHMTRLSYLDLSNNRLQYISGTARKQLENIATYNRNITVDLSGNNLKCTCETKEFIKWLAYTKVTFFKRHKYTCKLSSGDTQSLDKAIRVYETLQKNCTSYIPLIMTVVVFCILFITVLSFGLAYRNRWKLRYMYYMVKLRFDKKTREPATVEKMYTYDAFISYADDDRAFVHDILLKKLEQDGGKKLCIHKRDFLPGREIAENVTLAIHDSRKVIVIMSQNYIESNWCMFEFNMAKVESIYSRNKENILFLVFLHQISTKELPLNVLELVHTQSYIEYPRDEYGNTVFWEKLREVLS